MKDNGRVQELEARLRDNDVGQGRHKGEGQGEEQW